MPDILSIAGDQPKTVEEEAAALERRLWASYLADTRRQFPGFLNYFFAKRLARQRLDAAMAYWWEHSAPYWRDIYATFEATDAAH